MVSLIQLIIFPNATSSAVTPTRWFQFWQDDYLKWSPADYDGLTQLVLSPQLVWLPDFGVENR